MRTFYVAPCQVLPMVPIAHSRHLISGSCGNNAHGVRTHRVERLTLAGVAKEGFVDQGHLFWGLKDK